MNSLDSKPVVIPNNDAIRRASHKNLILLKKVKKGKKYEPDSTEQIWKPSCMVFIDCIEDRGEASI